MAAKTVMDKFNNLPKPAKQAVVGSASGFVAGFTIAKFGRYAGFSMGASILLLQLGHHYGWINIDWKSVSRDIKKVKEEVEKQADAHIPDIAHKIQNCVKENAITATSFAGGFLLGASSA